MYVVKDIILHDDVLQLWKEKFLPDADYFYFRNVPSYLEVKRRESIELSLDTRTSFLSWNIIDDAKYIAIISNEAFLKLDNEVQKAIMLEQVIVRRGFVFTLDELERIQHDDISIREILKPYSFIYNNKEYIIFQKFTWLKLPQRTQNDILLYIANCFVDYVSVSKERLGEKWNNIRKMNPYIATYFNSFVGINGPNCLGATLASIQKNRECAEIYINKWVHSKEFYETLKENNYNKVENVKLARGSIIVWEKNHQAIHACYVIDENIVFNKNGQTMFNPYQCLDMNDVFEAWKWVLDNEGKLAIYQNDTN